MAGGSGRPEELLRLAAHELRGPLTVAFTRLQLALQQVQGSPAEAPVEQALRSLRRLNRTIENLQGLGLEEDEPRPDESVDLGEVLGGLSSDAQLLSGRSLHLELRDPISVPIKRRSWLEQALANLIGNAVKYSDPPSPILLRARHVEGGCEIEVEDFGIGIAPAEVERLTDCRIRGSNVGARPGMGLGLYVTERLVSALGGTLEIRSQLGRGSIFRLRLPIAD